MGTEIQLGMITKFLRWMVVMVSQECEYTCCLRTEHLKMLKTVKFMLCIFCHNKSDVSFFLPKPFFFWRFPTFSMGPNTGEMSQMLCLIPQGVLKLGCQSLP